VKARYCEKKTNERAKKGEQGEGFLLSSKKEAASAAASLGHQKKRSPSRRLQRKAPPGQLKRKGGAKRRCAPGSAQARSRGLYAGSKSSKNNYSSRKKKLKGVRKETTPKEGEEK